MTKPLVSVAITCYNYGRYVGEAIESVLAQTYPNVEIIVLDDGSTDNTAEAVKPYLNRVRYERHQNLGLPATRNRGLELATGTYWLSLDADDTLEPDHLAKTVSFLEKHSNLAYTYVQVRYFGNFDYVSELQPFDLSRLKTHNFVSASSLTRLKILKKFGYDEQFRKGWEDWDLFLSMAAAGHTGELLDKPLLNYRQHGNSRENTINDDLLHADLLRRILIKHHDLYSLQEAEATANHWRTEALHHLRHNRQTVRSLPQRLSQLRLALTIRCGAPQLGYQLLYTLSPRLYLRLRGSRS